MIILELLDSISAILIYGVIQRLLIWTGRVITVLVIAVTVMVSVIKECQVLSRALRGAQPNAF